MSRRKTKDYKAVLGRLYERCSRTRRSRAVPSTSHRRCGKKKLKSWDRGAEYRYIRSLLALPFMPHTDVERAFEHLEQRANSMELQQLTRYMRTTWLENPYWSPRTWSIYQQRVRTNNDVEGWHTHLIANAGRANLTFYLLVPLLRREADLVDITHRLITEEQILRDLRSKFSRLQEQLQDLWEKYANDDLSASHLLKECVKFYGPAND